MSEGRIKDLEAKAASGDPEAFGVLIRRWNSDLRGVAWSIVESSEAADDIMQDAYLKAFQSLGSFDGRSSMKTWLHAICYRTAIDYVRYENYRRHETLEAAAMKPTSEATSGAVAARVELEAILSSLSPQERAMLMLTAGLGYSFDETAEIVGRRRGTVASTVGRIRKRIERWSES